MNLMLSECIKWYKFCRRASTRKYGPYSEKNYKVNKSFINFYLK